jgi:lysophospholipase L1-like esterase
MSQPRRSGPRRWLRRAALGAVLALVVAELGLRAFGVIDFPLYDADPRIGYIPRASQSGVFLGRNHWEVNEKSQGSPPWQPNRRTDLLLLGDSIVWGGNPLDQPQKLGPTLQRTLPDTDVWSAAAGSWGVPNEVEYLDRFPDVVQASEIVVWVINTGDLNERSQWASELTHPRHHPASALLYMAQKYALPRVQAWLPAPGSTPAPEQSPAAPPIFPETEALFRARLQDLAAARRVLVVVWPERAAAAGADPALGVHRNFVDHVTRLLPPGVLLLDAGDGPPSAALYRDGIHPSAAGNEWLAQRIAAALAAGH